MPAHREEFSSAAMQAAKRPAGVIPELRERVTCTPPPIANKAATQTLKPRGDITRSPKQGYQGSHKKDLKFFYNQQ